MNHTMHVQPKYYWLIKLGKKRAEFRKNDEKRQNIRPGDRITFICDNSSESITLMVSEVIKSYDFPSLLRKFPDFMFEEISREEHLVDLEKFYSPDEAGDGVVGIVLK